MTASTLRADLPKERVCTAHTTSGRPCRKVAIRGGRVCTSHGGMAPQVKLAAEERLRALVDPAISELARIIESGDSDSVRLAAVRDLLDRAGYGAKQTIRHEWVQQYQALAEEYGVPVEEVYRLAGYQPERN